MPNPANGLKSRTTGRLISQSGVNGVADVGDGFRPSQYTGNVTATTTVSGQSGAIATGATRFRLQNLDGTNYCLFAFGTSAANAETNAANGIAIEAAQKEMVGVPENATHYAYLGDTGSVTLNISQGV